MIPLTTFFIVFLFDKLIKYIVPPNYRIKKIVNYWIHTLKWWIDLKQEALGFLSHQLVISLNFNISYKQLLKIISFSKKINKNVSRYCSSKEGQLPLTFFTLCVFLLVPIFYSILNSSFWVAILIKLFGNVLLLQSRLPLTIKITNNLSIFF